MTYLSKLRKHFRKWELTGLALLALGLLLDLALNGKVWWWSWVSAIPASFILLAIFIIAAVLGYRRRWAALLIFFLLVIIYSPRIDFYLPKLPFYVNSRETITIFSWNTEYWLADNSPQHFMKFLTDNKSDIMQLQEAMLYDLGQVDVQSELAKKFPGFKFYQSGEVATFTRLEVLNTKNLSEHQLRVDIQLGSEVVSFYNVHIPVHVVPPLLKRPFVFVNDVFKRFYWRQQEFDILWKDIKSNPNPKVITGDFNTSRNMAEIDQFFGEFQDAFSTLNSGVPLSFAFGDTKLWRIDYVFVTPELIRLHSYRNIDPENLSDHDAMRVRFSVD